MRNKTISFLVAFAMLISIVVQPVSAVVNTASQEASIEKLSLCITDNNAPNAEALVESRFDKYIEAGFESVRIMPGWTTTSSTNWTLQEESSLKLQTAVEAGLSIKLIPMTVMYNPDYLITNSDTRMETQNGQLSNSNCISYWYDGLETHINAALTAQLTALRDINCLDSVKGIILDAGAAGETIYPAGWTQNTSSNAMWCYADNAVEDFRVEMADKYSSITQANAAWGTNFLSFESVSVPKPGEVTGQMWEDTLTWYIETKRDFIEREIQIYQNVLETLNCEDIRIIIYLPGTWYSEADWNNCVINGTVTDSIMLGADNRAVVDLADKYNCYLQYTGVETRGGVDYVRQYMYDCGYEDIPVFGENAAHDGLTTQIADIFDNIMSTNLRGVDFTDCSYLFDQAGNTNTTYTQVKEEMVALKAYLNAYDYSYIPNIYENVSTTAIEGDALKLTLNINKDNLADISYLFLNIASLNYEVQEGDVLEYDVKLDQDMHGIGHIDAMLAEGGYIRDCGVIDNSGMNCHPMGDLSPYAMGVSYHRSMYIGDSACSGKTIQNLQLAAHPQVSAYGDYANGIYTVWYDNIRITNNGVTKMLIFADGSDYMGLTVGVASSSGMSGSVALVTVGENQGAVYEYGSMLQMQLNINKAANSDISYVFHNIATLNYTIEQGDVLEYDVILAEDMHGIGHIDATLSGGIPLRDCGVLDTAGRNCHPMGDLSVDAYGNVYHRCIEIGNSSCVGQTIVNLQLAAHPQASAYGDYENGTYTVWYDNIKITNNGVTKVVVYADEKDFSTLTPSIALSSGITSTLMEVDT